MTPLSESPSELGRGAVIRDDQAPPSGLSGATVFHIDQNTLAAPGSIVEEMHHAWAQRSPYVVKLGISPVRLKELSLEVDTRQPWQLGDQFSLMGQRLLFLAWNNNLDWRSGEPIWWWARKAIALGAKASSSKDVELETGESFWIDGGPIEPLNNVISYTAIERGSLKPMFHAMPQSELAQDQLGAVTHRRGAARIIAPAGSGKTRVLTERLRHLLKDWQVDASAVCAVAYNTRAAKELAERTTGTGAHIRTLNSLALAIVNGTGGFARSQLESRHREVIGEPEVRRILQGLVEVPRKTNQDPWAVWIEALSAARLGLVDPATIESSWEDVDGFAEVHNSYRQVLKQNNVLDFDEQIVRAIEILLQDPEARSIAQQRCRNLLVDEFQDLTPAHMLMLRLLASPALNVFGVGDDDQVIYGYAGATPEYLVSFDKWFPGAASHSLEINYRCPPDVVTAANNTLTRNAIRISKDTKPAPGRKNHKNELSFIQSDQPAHLAVELIKEWCSRTDPSNIAVLSRVNVTLLPVQVLLTEAGVPHRATVDQTVLDRTGMRAALAYLRMGTDTGAISRSDILETIRRPSRRIARNVADMMTKRPMTSIGDLRRLANSLTGNDAQRVLGYVADINRVADAIRSGGTENSIRVIRNDIGLSETLATLDGSRRELDRSSHADDLTALAAVAHLHPDVETFESWLRTTLGQASRDGSGVELATVHRVKGREWDNVIVFGADRELMPHRLASDRYEERRVFHVAITRCRKHCSVLYTAASPFIEETNSPGEPERPRVITDRSAPKAEVAGIRAFVGMEIDVAGTAAHIVDLTDSGAMATVGRVQTMVPYGTVVTHFGKRLALQQPRSAEASRIYENLKEWRYKTARQAKVPAYTVLHDSHLEGIADAKPQDLNELSNCKGLGPTKLDKWGDEILSVIEESLV